MDRRHFLASIPASLFVTGFPNLGLTKPKRDGRLIAIILEGGLDGLAAVPPRSEPGVDRQRGMALARVGTALVRAAVGEKCCTGTALEWAAIPRR